MYFNYTHYKILQTIALDDFLLDQEKKGEDKDHEAQHSHLEFDQGFSKRKKNVVTADF